MAAEKETQPPHPVSGDTEAAAGQLAKKKRRNCIILIVVIVVINTAIDAIVSATILKARNPKFRIREAAVTSSKAGVPASLSLQFAVKNTNFGRYEYPRAAVVFMHKGVEVGTADVADSKVGWRSTKKFNLEHVDLNLGKLSNTTTSFTVTAQAKLNGRAAIVFVIMKMKGADLDCTMDILRSKQQITSIACKS